MKFTVYIALLVSVFLTLGAVPKPAPNPKLTVVVNGITERSGSVRVVLYNNPSTFLDSKGYAFTKNTPVGNNQAVQFDFYIPNGYYAITCYHDVNDNHKLDQNYLGVPVEAYAMSNNVSVKWRRPTFEETKFAFNQQTQTVYLTLQKWQDR